MILCSNFLVRFTFGLNVIKRRPKVELLLLRTPYVFSYLVFFKVEI